MTFHDRVMYLPRRLSVNSHFARYFKQLPRLTDIQLHPALSLSPGHGIPSYKSKFFDKLEKRGGKSDGRQAGMMSRKKENPIMRRPRFEVRAADRLRIETDRRREEMRAGRCSCTFRRIANLGVRCTTIRARVTYRLNNVAQFEKTRRRA